MSMISYRITSLTCMCYKYNSPSTPYKKHLEEKFRKRTKSTTSVPNVTFPMNDPKRRCNKGQRKYNSKIPTWNTGSRTKKILRLLFLESSHFWDRSDQIRLLGICRSSPIRALTSSLTSLPTPRLIFFGIKSFPPICKAITEL